MASAFAGAVGQDNFGEDIYRASLEDDLDMRFLQQMPAPTLMAVVYNINPPAYRFLGENSADLLFDPTRLPAGWLREAQWLHVGGISLSRWPLADTIIGVIETARAAGVKVSFDPNARITHRHPEYPKVFEYVARHADLMKFSDEDLEFFFPNHTEADALQILRSFNPTAPIVVTRGSKGATLFESNVYADLPIVPVKVVDTVGAGDALCAGLLTSATTQPNQPWLTHLRLGLRAASAACARAGAYAPTMADLAALHS